jgi:N-acetylneuraminic acid mutarotase
MSAGFLLMSMTFLIVSGSSCVVFAVIIRSTFELLIAFHTFVKTKLFSMKKIYALSIFILSLSVAKADYWTQKADLPLAGHKRVLPISFSYGDYGYIGWGTDTTNMSVKDLWAYNANTNTWTQKATLPGSPANARSGATCFMNSNTGKAYAGLGQNTLGTLFSDWWEYNVATNSWTSKAPFTGGARALASGVFAGNYGYVAFGNGLAGDFKDIYLYDPISNSWMAKPDLPSFERRECTAFAIGSKAYFATGYSTAFTSCLLDLWEFDTSNDTWTQKTSYLTDSRFGAASFSLWGMGYVGIGKTDFGTYSNDICVYDPLNDTWYARASFGGAGRFEGAGFAIHDSGYICSGGSPSSFYKDLWKYTPDTITGINEFEVWSTNLNVYPNPAKELIVISSERGVNKNTDLTISDISGKMVVHQILKTGERIIRINVKDFHSGMYLISIANGKQKTVKKFLKE